MTSSPVTPKVGAIAVLLHEGKFLLVQRGKDPGRGLWGFPGGHVEPGEAAMDAAVRELKEETGVIAKARDCATCVDIIGRNDDGTLTYHFLLAVVACDYISGDPVAADDAAAAEWVPAEEVIQELRALNQKVAEVAARIWEQRSQKLQA